jgi:hypothetical protein
MATYSATNYTKYAAASPAAFLGPEWEGRIKGIVENYTFASAAAGSIVNVGILRKGEVFFRADLTGADLSSAGTLQVGDTELDGSASIADDDRYLAATVFTTANQVTECNASAGRGYKASKDMIIQVKTATEEVSGLINFRMLKLTT